MSPGLYVINGGSFSVTGSGTVVGNGVTIKNNVVVWEGVTVKDFAFLGPCCVFTNDLRPRSPRFPGGKVRYQDKRWLSPTVVGKGASIGANATIFSVANALLLGPTAGIAAPERLVDVGMTRPSSAFDTMSYPTFADLRDRNRTLNGMYAYELEPKALSLGADDGATRLYGHFVSAGFFEVLGAVPARGGRSWRCDAKSPRVDEGQCHWIEAGLAAMRRTTSPAAARPKAAVTKTALPNPLAQSSRRLPPGSGSAAQVPSDQG